MNACINKVCFMTYAFMKYLWQQIVTQDTYNKGHKVFLFGAVIGPLLLRQRCFSQWKLHEST